MPPRSRRSPDEVPTNEREDPRCQSDADDDIDRSRGVKVRQQKPHDVTALRSEVLRHGFGWTERESMSFAVWLGIDDTGGRLSPLEAPFQDGS